MSQFTTRRHHDYRLSSLTSSMHQEDRLTVARNDLPATGWRSAAVSKFRLRDKRRPPPLPQSNAMFHESRYKTELCRQFEELGDCEYGERCLFAHGMDELKNIPHRHPKFKTERCSAYFEHGFCSFGPRCSFIHEKPDAVQILLRLQEQVKQRQQEEREAMARLMQEEETLVPLAADSTRRLPVFTHIAP